MICWKFVYPEDVVWSLWTGNALTKSGDAAKAKPGDTAKVKSVEAVKATSDRSTVTNPDEQLISSAEMELRIKLLRENRLNIFSYTNVIKMPSLVWCIW